jgi:hypothetical protein
MKRKKSELVAEKAKYQPTAREQAAIDKNVARQKSKSPAPRLKVLNDSKAPNILLDHPDLAVASRLLMEALGTGDIDFVDGLIRQLALVGDQLDEGRLNFLLGVIKGIEPNDQLEAMLAAQMAVVHVMVMKFGRRLEHIETLQQQDSAERALNKLARTFTTQLEALKRYRTGGEQKVTVQHVSVSDGGQAIVGNVTQAVPESTPAKSAKSTAALTDGRQAAMPIIDEPKRTRAPLRREQKNDGRSST